MVSRSYVLDVGRPALRPALRSGLQMARFGRPMREMVAEIGFSWAEWRELTFDGPWRPWRAIAGGGEGTGVESGRLRLVKRRGGRKRAPRNEATA